MDQTEVQIKKIPYSNMNVKLIDQQFQDEGGTIFSFIADHFFFSFF